MTDWLMPGEPLALLPGALFKFLLAIVLAGAVGLERERKGRAAGLRTHVLVCLGSTLSMVVSDVIAAQWAAATSTVWLDRGRIAAGIITGVGFLGAGTIITVGGHQRGLTTAAMIWFVAALGIAVGAGLYVIATAATVLALLLVVGLEFVEGRLRSAERFILTLEVPEGLDVADDVMAFLKRQKLLVQPSRLRVADRGESVEMSFDISSRSRPRLDLLLKTLLEEFPAARRVECKR